MKKSITFLISILCVGCLVPEYETSEQALAIDGPWQPPADLVAQSQAYEIPYIGAGDWVGPDGCGGDFLQGTRELQEWIDTYWPQVILIGGYSCRAIAGSTQMSVHATGRALDIHIPLDEGEADNDLGDPLANYLIEHAQEMGIQIIIWDRWKWSMGRSGDARSEPYTGQHPHHDHLHIELTPEAADRGYPWWQTEMEGPDLGPCGVPLVKEGGTIDNKDACFTAYGPAQFWRTETGGHDGDLRWTNAFQGDDSSNWARWNVNLVDAGTYRVEYFSVPEFAVFDSTRYAIGHNGETTEVTVDQSAGESGWNSLGEFEFAAGPDQWVDVFDNTAADVPNDQHIIADAVRLTRVDLPDGMDPEMMDRMDMEPPIVMNEDPDLDAENDTLPGDDSGCSSIDASPTSLWWCVLLIAIRRRRSKT